MKKVVGLFLIALALSSTCLAQVGRTQDAPLDSKRIGFSPTVVRFANLAAQDVTTWSGLPGQATVTTGVKAPDGTLGAAQLSITSPVIGGKIVYSAPRTLRVGDWLVFGTWVKVVSLSGLVTSLEGQAVARITASDPTAGYGFDIDSLNYRELRASARADTQWEWITSAARIIAAPPTPSAMVEFELQCSIDRSLAFYAPLLHHIQASELTDSEVAALLRNLYSVPDGVPSGNMALLRGQTLYCYSGGAYSPCAFGGGSPGTPDNSVQYRASTSTFGGISGVTSDGTNLTAGSANLRATRPRITTSIDDANGNKLIGLSSVASAVNQLSIANGPTGSSPIFGATGSDTNIDISIQPKGTGRVSVGGGLEVISSGETLSGVSVSHTQSVATGPDYAPMKVVTDFTGVASTASDLINVGILGALRYGTSGIAAKGTAHTFTSTLDVINSADSGNEFANYMGWARLGSAASPQTGRIWFGDFSAHGGIGLQPNQLNGITMILNNYYNGSPSSNKSATYWAITKPGQGAGSENGHSTAQTYPADVGIGIAGWSGNPNGTPTTRGFTKGIQLGGNGSGWMLTSERSLIGTGIDIADVDINGINFHDPRGTGVTGIKFSTDSISETWGWLFDASALVDGDLATGSIRLPGLDGTKSQISWGDSPILYRNALSSLVLSGAFIQDNTVANTSTVANLLTSNCNSTGTPAAGFGQSMTWELASNTTVNREAARMSVSWVTVADAQRTSVIDWATVDNANALRNVLRTSGNGINTGSSLNLLGTNGAETRTQTVSELITLNTAGLTTDTTIDLPAGSIILSVTTRVVTAITTATTFSVGDNAGNAARFSAAAGGLTAGSTRVGIDHWNPTNTDANGPRQVSNAKVRLTTDVNPGAGQVRVTIHLINFIPATG